MVDDDPISAIATSHLARMQEINDEGFRRSREISEHATSEMRRYSALRVTVLEKLLESNGVLPPVDVPEV